MKCNLSGVVVGVSVRADYHGSEGGIACHNILSESSTSTRAKVSLPQVDTVWSL